MAKARILVVEDEQHVAELITLYLDKEGFETVTAGDGPRALQMARELKPDLVLLDLMLPGMDGLDVFREMRKESRVPVIVVTARGEEVDRVVGLELGADDYVVKPFSPRELVARVKAVLRRSVETLAGEQQAIQFPGLRIDRTRHQVFVGGDEVAVTPMEFRLLWYLASHPDKVCTREELLREVWGEDSYSDARTVDVHIKRIRRKVQTDPQGEPLIATVWGVGYRFQAPRAG
jgi:phosphate regulon transcriptional regulator PhoB